MIWIWSLLLVGLGRATPFVHAAALSPTIVGTYNATFWSVPLPKCLLESFVPNEYLDSLPSPDAGGNIAAVVELGREANSGPAGLQLLNFEEAKIEVPSIRRVDSSTTGFTYKTRILVDNLIDVPSSFLVFGLNTAFSSFTPPNSSDAPSLAYSASKGLTASAVRDDLEPTLPASVFEQNAAQPWFGDGLQCGIHVYDFVNAKERKRVKGTITISPLLQRYTSSCGNTSDQPIVVKDVEGLHLVASWGIYGPASCTSFAAP